MQEEKVQIHSRLSVSAVALQKVLEIDVMWEISGRGEFSVKMHVEKRHRISRTSEIWYPPISERGI